MADFVKLNGYDVKDAVSRASITSIQSTLNGIKRPEDYGCVGNGIVDDTENFQTALAGGGYILGTPGKNYRVTAELILAADTVLDLNNATVTADGIRHIFYNFETTDTEILGYAGRGNITIRNGILVGGCISFIHSHDVLIENIHMINVNNDHMMEICACNNYTVKNCIFEGLSNLYPSVREYINIDPCVYAAFPWIADGSSTFDGTKNKNLFFLNNVFRVGSSASYVYMQNAIGCHGHYNASHENIIIDGNIVEGNADTEVAFRLIDMTQVMVRNNLMKSKWGTLVNGSSYVTIEGNSSICIDATARAFIIFDSMPNTHISINDNTLVNRSGYITGSFNDGDVTFDLLQPTRVFQGDNSSVSSTIPFTSVNKIMLQTGAISGGNMAYAEIRSFLTRGFLVGETYPIWLKTGLATFTITDATHGTISTNTSDVYTNCRQMLLAKDIEFAS